MLSSDHAVLAWGLLSQNLTRWTNVDWRYISRYERLTPAEQTSLALRIEAAWRGRGADRTRLSRLFTERLTDRLPNPQRCQAEGHLYALYGADAIPLLLDISDHALRNLDQFVLSGKFTPTWAEIERWCDTNGVLIPQQQASAKSMIGKE